MLCALVLIIPNRVGKRSCPVFTPTNKSTRVACMGWPAGKAWTWRRAGGQNNLRAVQWHGRTCRLRYLQRAHLPESASGLRHEGDDPHHQVRRRSLAHDAAAWRLHGSARDGRQTKASRSARRTAGDGARATIPTSPSGVTARWSTTWIIAARPSPPEEASAESTSMWSRFLRSLLTDDIPGKPGDAPCAFRITTRLPVG